eukprot:Skav201124  [mRNA]  locus=scaffold4373:48211:48675:+ [translate_table: standard]
MTHETWSASKFTKKTCKHRGLKHCNGSECTFAQFRDQELREAPRLLGTQLCFQFRSEGRCSKGADCAFAHGKDELPSPLHAGSPQQPQVEIHDALNICYIPEESDTYSKVQVLQMHMDQLQALYMRLASLLSSPVVSGHHLSSRPSQGSELFWL